MSKKQNFGIKRLHLVNQTKVRKERLELQLNKFHNKTSTIKMAVVAEETGGHPGNHNNQMKKVKERIPATYLQTLAMKTVCQGSVPKHVAFIMDGNRRYARENGLKSVSDGHRLGRESLNLVSIFCLEIFLLNICLISDGGQML